MRARKLFDFVFFLSASFILASGIFFWLLKISNNSAVISAKDISVKIIDYRQAWLPKLKAAGKCWTSSLAASSNPTAWKCAVGYGVNEVFYEVCFEISRTKNIVCDINPEKSGSGFEVVLTSPLTVFSREGESQGKIWPWRIKLKNGVNCDLLTDKVGYIKKEAFHYLCDDGLVFGEIIRKDNYWFADFAKADEKGTKVLERKKLNIVTAWI